MVSHVRRIRFVRKRAPSLTHPKRRFSSRGPAYPPSRAPLFFQAFGTVLRIASRGDEQARHDFFREMRGELTVVGVDELLHGNIVLAH